MSNRSFKRAHARRTARERRRAARQRLLVAGATVGASAVLASSAQAAGPKTYQVQTNGDGTDNAGCQVVSGNDYTCVTLRDAIGDANADGANKISGDTITFNSSLKGDTISLDSGYGALYISDAPGLTIDGSGAPGLSVSGGGNVQVFTINQAGSVSISNLTITDGVSPQCCSRSSGTGGAIKNGGDSLTLSHDTISNSSAKYGGGGVYSYGPLTVSDSTITGNTATNTRGAGAGIQARSDGGDYAVKITGSTISNNDSSGSGGGIASYADDFTISDSQITGNHAAGTSVYSSGGGMLMGTGYLSMTGSTVSGNTSAESGGGVETRYDRGTTISDSKITGNNAYEGGGLGTTTQYIGGCGPGCAPVSGRSRVSPRQPANHQPAGVTQQLLVSDSTISGNQAAYGAGMAIDDSPRGIPTTISGSTISGNTASNADATSAGGGLAISYDVSHAIDVVDSTISGNSAGNGGGVVVGDRRSPEINTGGSISFDNSTIAANTATAHGGGIYLSQYQTSAGSGTTSTPTTYGTGTANLGSTIVAGNKAAGSPNDLGRGPLASSGGFDAAFSLIQNQGNATFTNKKAVILGKSAQLGALANNGGPTETMLPSQTSPVIDQGVNPPPVGTTTLKTDQRGDPRTVNNGDPRPSGGDGTDIGAVELSQFPVGVSLGPATGVNWYHAVLHAKINTNGRDVTWHFDYGTSTAYGNKTSSQSISLGNGTVPVYTTLILNRGTTYHYRIVATNGAGRTATSAGGVFRTLAPTIHANPSAVEPGKRIHLFGSTGGCAAGTTVTLESWAFSHKHMADGMPAVFTTADSNGQFSVFPKIPKHRKAGTYGMTGRCGSGPLWFAQPAPGHAGDVGGSDLLARIADASAPGSGEASGPGSAVRPVLIRVRRPR